MIAVVDSGVANLASILAAMRRLDEDAQVTSDAQIIRGADHVILPGVGAAAAAMRQLQAKDLVEVLRTLRQPVLGICLGMQLLFARSEEGQDVSCLEVMPGRAKRLEVAPDRPVPHMGWNRIHADKADHPLLRHVADGSFMYFAHSYAVPAGESALASAEYGETFAAVVARDNYFGCQFHPERSGAAGRQIIENFLGL